MPTLQLFSRTRIATVAAIVALASALTGCGAPESAAPVPENVKAALLALGSQPVDLSIAHRMAVRSCMEAKGFDIPYNSGGSGERRAALISIEGMFATEAAARRTGYSTTIAPGGDLVQSYVSSLPPKQQETFRRAKTGSGENLETITLSGGVVVSRSTEGCVAEADRAVYGSVRNALQVNEFINEVNAQSSDFVDSALRDLDSRLDSYVQCMNKRGVNVTGFNAGEIAEDRFGKYRQAHEPPNREEQQLAANDYRCQNEAGFSKALNQTFIDNASAWILSNEDYILGVRELMDKAMDRAKRIIDGA